MDGFFLGAHGEQRALFEELFVAYARNHFEWRAAFHPEDRQPDHDAEPELTLFADRTRAELQRLAAALQRSVPVSSARYLGHMTSDLLLPAVLAQMVTILYNPNNVTSEVAPVTVDMERAAAAQLCAMVGYPSTRSWGHLTSGGTVANIESLWIARAARCWPLAVLRASASVDFSDAKAALPDDEWAALNMPLHEIAELHTCVSRHLAGLDPRDAARVAASIDAERIEQRGAAAYPPLRVLVPVTAHYSWEKAVRLLGIGGDQLITVPVTARMRMDGAALSATLARCRDERATVLAVVPVVGTTEYGTIDPVHEVIMERAKCEAVGQSFWVHADAAWGGYFASMVRDEDGGTIPHACVREGFRWFPSDEVYRAFVALADCDSVTVDPHKLGYVPFGVGALLLRDGRMRAFVSQSAPYVFDGDGSRLDPEPGRYALEGSRPGAMAAAVCIAHRVLPLHAAAFGRLPADSVRANEYLYARLMDLSERVADVARVVLPYEPDTNLICIAVNPNASTTLDEMNRFMERLYAGLKAGSGPVRPRDFYASRTRLPFASLAPDARRTLSDRLGVRGVDGGSVVLLRHTLMNPRLDSDAGHGILDAYCAHLEARVRALVN